MSYLERRPEIVVGCIIIKDNKVLLGQRRVKPGRGNWTLPGGHVEYKEKLAACAIRETREETGLTVINPRFASKTIDIFPDENRQFVSLFYICDYASGNPQTTEPDKNDHWGWYDWGNFPTPLFLPLVNLLTQGFNPFLMHGQKMYNPYHDTL